MADYSITGDTKLDTSGFTNGVSTMTVAAGTLVADLVKSATGKMAGLATSAVSVGQGFEAAMSQVAATMGKSTDEIQSLTDTAKELGRTTKFTASEAADALNFLALAGYDAEKAAEVLPSVLDLAAAGAMDLGYASDLVTDAMSALRIEATKTNVDEFGDKLAMAASKANANVAQLGEAILTVGGTAANLKNGTTELTTALGLLANVGIKGAEGGTHLRNIILSLQSPVDDAAELMDALGLAVYDADGNMRGLDEILTDLNASMEGMTQGEKDSIINRLFNKTDLAAVNGLLEAQGEQWNTLAAYIDSADGAMSQMAVTQIDNLQGAITIAQSALEGLELALYEQIEPTLSAAVSMGTEILTALTDAMEEGGPEAMMAAAGGIIGELMQGITDALPGLVSAGVEAIAQLAEGIVTATPQMLTSAAEIVSALVQSLSTALPQLVSTGLAMITQLGEGLKKGLPEFLAQALPVVADFASGLRDNIGQIVDTGIEFILNLAQGLADGLPTLIEQLPGIVSDIAGIINDNAPKLLMAGVHLIWTLGKGLIEAIPTVIANIPQICQSIFDVFTAFRWLDIGKYIVDGLWNGITAGWNALISKVTDLVNLLPKAVKTVLGIHSPSKVFSEIGLNICRGLAQGIEAGSLEAEKAAQTLVASVTDVAESLINGAQTTTKTITEIMADGTEQQKQVITEVQDAVIDGALVTIERVRTIAADGTETVTQTIKESALNDFDGLWKELQDRADTGVLGTFDTLYTAVQQQDWAGVGKWAAATLYNGLSADRKEQIESFALGLIDQLNSTLKGAQAQVSATAWGIGESIYRGVTSGFTEILSQADQLGSALQASFETIKGPLSTAAKAISDGLSGGLLSAFPSIYAAMGGLITSIGAAFEGMLSAISTALSATVFGIPAGVLVAGAAVALGVAIAAVVAKLGGKKGSTSGSGSAPSAPSTGGGNSNTGSSSGSLGGDITVTPDADDLQDTIQDATDRIEDLVQDNTDALLKTNAALADMVRQANALVLSDNMRIGSTVAASGTAQIRAAADQYHTSQTIINQTINSKAQTAADLARETRWEADRALAQKR